MLPTLELRDRYDKLPRAVPPAARRSLRRHGSAEDRRADAARRAWRARAAAAAAPGIPGPRARPRRRRRRRGHRARRLARRDAGGAGALEYCQVPRGKRACAVRRSVRAARATASARSRCCCRGPGVVQIVAPLLDGPRRSSSSVDGGNTFAVAHDRRGARPRSSRRSSGRASHLADVGLRARVVRRASAPTAAARRTSPSQFGAATESLETSLAPYGRRLRRVLLGACARARCCGTALGDPNLPAELGRGPAARRGRRRRRAVGRAVAAPGSPTSTAAASARTSACAGCAPAAGSGSAVRVSRDDPFDTRRFAQGPRGDMALVCGTRSDDASIRALAQRAPLDAAAAAVPRQRPDGPARRRSAAAAAGWCGTATRATSGSHPIRIAAIPRAAAPLSGATPGLQWERWMQQRSRRPRSQPRGPRQAARLRDRRDAGGRRPLRARASCCAPPAWRSSASSSSTASSRTRTTTSGQGKVEELKELHQGGGRERRRRRRRADPAPGAQPREGARRAGARPHGRDPRHLRRPRPHGRGQAPGRAGAARVQHGPHARPVDAPRASRRRPRRRRHRHPGPGRVADRDGPPAGARPHHRAQAPARPRALHPRRAARRARARAPAERRAGRLHQRRQVDAAQRAHRLRGRRPRPALPHAGPDHPHASSCRAARS